MDCFVEGVRVMAVEKRKLLYQVRAGSRQKGSSLIKHFNAQCFEIRMAAEGKNTSKPGALTGHNDLQQDCI